MRSVRALITAAAVAAAFLTLTACAPESPATPNGTSSSGVESILGERGWDGLTGTELVEALEALPVADRPADLIASVTSDAVTLTAEDGTTTALELDGFYLSVAPYVSQTHPCTFHSLTTCRGELSTAPMTITVTDARTGAVVAERDGRTEDNGFAGLWLPRDGEYTVSVDGEAGSATATVRTGAEDPTCLTTLQLS